MTHHHQPVPTKALIVFGLPNLPLSMLFGFSGKGALTGYAVPGLMVAFVVCPILLLIPMS
jgi:hypothetical protein